MKLLNKKRVTVIAGILACVIIAVTVLLVLLPSFKPVVIGSKNYGITSDMVSYLIEEELDRQVKYYKSDIGQNYLEAVSLDPKKNLKKQTSPYGSSWFDYFYGTVTEEAKSIILACELAKAENISLTDEEKSGCVSQAKTAEHRTNIKQSNLIKLFEYRTLSEKYKESLNSKLNSNDYNEYYNQNKNKYDCIDYKCITVRVDVDSSLNGGKSVDELTAQARERADLLLEDIRQYGFDVPAAEYLQETGSNETLQELTFVSQKYVDNLPFLNWAFSGERKAGDCTVLEGKYSFSVYRLEKTPYPYDYRLSDGVVASFEYGENKASSLSQLRAKLDKIDSESAFEEFILDNGFERLKSEVLSKDVLPEPVLQWMYSEERKTGDTELCIYGKKIYAMRYSGNGGSYFDYVLKNDCRKSKYDALIKEAADNIGIKVKNSYKFLINV